MENSERRERKREREREGREKEKDKHLDFHKQGNWRVEITFKMAQC